MVLSDVTTARLHLDRWEPGGTRALAGINALPAGGRATSTRASLHARGDRHASPRASPPNGRRTVSACGPPPVSAPPADTDRLRRARPPACGSRRSLHEVEIGWRLHPDAWGHGYATEAGRAALEAARDQLALTRVIAIIDPANTPSLAVATRLGMTVERDLPHPQRPGDIAIHAIRT